MKPGIRKTLSVLVLVVGLLYWVPLVKLWGIRGANQNPFSYYELGDRASTYVFYLVSMVALTLAAHLQPIGEKFWSRIYFLQSLTEVIVGFVVATPAAMLGFCLMLSFCTVRKPLLAKILSHLGLLAFAAFWVFFTQVIVCDPVRDSVSRAKADLRSMATAIEMYQIEHNSYPASTTTGPYGFWQSDERMPSFAGGTGIAGLTTPVAYITDYFQDPFRKLSDHRTFAYYCNGPMWILISAGPNCRFELPPDRLTLLLAAPHLPNDELFNYTYDPTNGVFSAGDIFRLKQ